VCRPLFCCFACAVDFRRALCMLFFSPARRTNCTRSTENVYHNAMRPSSVAVSCNAQEDDFCIGMECFCIVKREAAVACIVPRNVNISLAA
jgi:hypothetical protein